MRLLRQPSAIVMLSLLASACTTRGNLDSPTNPLVGRWKCGTQISTDSDGSRKTIDIPETIMEFFDDGRYVSTNTRVTHRGTYERVSKDQIAFKIRDANEPKFLGISGINQVNVTSDTLRMTTPTRGFTALRLLPPHLGLDGQR